MTRTSTILVALAAPAVALAWTPSEEDTAVYKALSARDGAPLCADVEALVTDPVTALKNVVEHAEMPPWAGIRAAECLVTRHSAEIEAEITAWVGASETKGLALVVFNHLDEMPEDIALRVAGVALNGPLSNDARERIEAGESAALRGLLVE